MWNFNKIASLIPLLLGAVMKVDDDIKAAGASKTAAQTKAAVMDAFQTSLATMDAIAGKSLVNDADVLTAVGGIVDAILAIKDLVVTRTPIGPVVFDFTKVLVVVSDVFAASTQIEAQAVGLKGPDKKAAGLSIIKTLLDTADNVVGHALVNDADVMTAVGGLFDAFVAVANIVKAKAPVAPVAMA
jgi:hypothetical protein